MARRRRGIEVFSLSFLDVVSCGFGAVILLLIIARTAEPLVIQRVQADLRATVARLGRDIQGTESRAATLDRKVRAQRAARDRARAPIPRLEAELSAIQARLPVARAGTRAEDVIAGRLTEARQKLTAEMRRLRARARRRPSRDTPIGGVPVDSDYIVFIIDTSGSMFENAWPLVLRKLTETLAVYPHVKGIQVMNDMGRYMYSQYAGRWIPDTPARRRAIVERLRTWSPFSNSSPVEGITEAIRRFAAPDKKVSLYVFGDEFSTGTLESVVREVKRLNPADRAGHHRVRIHAIGFPTQFARPEGAQITGLRFAALMRILASGNDGTFVGLNSYRR